VEFLVEMAHATSPDKTIWAVHVGDRDHESRVIFTDGTLMGVIS
jgi:hypothetical protein